MGIDLSRPNDGSNVPNLPKFSGDMCGETMYGININSQHFTANKVTHESTLLDYGIGEELALSRNVWDPVNNLYITKSLISNLIVYFGYHAESEIFQLGPITEELDSVIIATTGIAVSEGQSYYVMATIAGILAVHPVNYFTEDGFAGMEIYTQVFEWTENPVYILAFFNHTDESKLFAFAAESIDESSGETYLIELSFDHDNKSSVATKLGVLRFSPGNYLESTLYDQIEPIFVYGMNSYYNWDTLSLVMRYNSYDVAENMPVLALEYTVLLSEISNSEPVFLTETLLGTSNEVLLGAVPCHQQWTRCGCVRLSTFDYWRYKCVDFGVQGDCLTDRCGWYECEEPV